MTLFLVDLLLNIRFVFVETILLCLLTLQPLLLLKLFVNQGLNPLLLSSHLLGHSPLFVSLLDFLDFLFVFCPSLVFLE
jgi:hypothetical protein